MSETIDSLDIQIKASAAKADDAIDKLVGKLEKLSSSLGSLNTDGLGNLAKGVNDLSGAMQGLKGVRTSSISGLASALKELGGVSIGNTLKAAVNIKILASSINSLGAVSGNAKEFGNVANNISKLGSKNIQNAIDNMPKIATAMRQLMSELSKSPRVSQNLIDMTNALAKLSSQHGNSVSSNNRFVSGLNRTSTSMLSAKKHTIGLAAAFGKFYASYFLAIRGIKKLWNSIESSMDYVETFNYWNVTLDKIGTEFGNQFADYGYDSADAYAESFRGRLKELTAKMTGYKIGDAGDLTSTSGMNLGLDPEQLMNFQARIGAVTNSVGLVGETSTNVAKALSMLSADMSSFTNTDLSSVMTNFQSGIIGQSRALYKYGIDITNATLQTYAYENGISKAVSEMTQAEKMQLRLIAILDQSKVAWGDQANTINSVANQYRILKQQVSNLARVLGNLFLPIVKTVLPVVNGLVISLNRLFTTLGFHLWGDGWLKDLQDGISGGYGGDDLEDFADSADDAADSLGSAADAAKKLKTATLGIDEFNIISPQDGNDNGSGTGDGGSIDLSGAIADALADYESVWDKALAESENKAQEIADAICNAFKNGDYKGIGIYISEGITSGLEGIDWKRVYTVADGFGTGLAEFLNGLITPELFGAVGSTIAGSLNTAVHASLSFGEEFDWKNLGEAIGTGVNDFFADFDFKSLARTLNTWVDGLEDAIGEALKKISWKDIIDAIGGFFGELELDTVAVLIGGFALKYEGKKLTDKLFTNVILKKLGISSGQLNLYAGIAIGIFGITVYSLFNAKDFINSLKEKIGNLTVDKEDVHYNGEDLTIETPLKWKIKEIKMDFDEWRHEIYLKFQEFKADVSLNVNMLLPNAKEKINEWKKDVNEWWGNEKFDISEWFDSTGIPEWWEEDVSPWFTKEKWQELGENVKSGLTTKWNEFSAWWRSTGFYNWWNKDVKPWFTKEKWKTVSSGMKTGIQDKWEEFRTWWNNTGFYNWWNNEVKPKFKKEEWSFSGIKDGLMDAFNSAFNSISQAWDNFKSSISNTSISVHASTQVEQSKTKVKGYATGGYPNTGEIFMARENGITEMVGSIGNHAAVANNDQIVAGIQYGVESAVERALAPYLDVIAQNTGATANNTAGGMKAVVNVDSRELVSAYDDRKKRNGFSFAT